VPSHLYTESYFLEACGGSETWRASAGAEAAGIYHGCLELSGMRAGATLVDIGTGRGELIALAVERGAARAVGVDYSAAAVRLASHTIATRGQSDRCLAIQGDCRALPVCDGVADLVTMLDVVEHLTPTELAASLQEARRVLRPGGRVFVHTAPTRTLYSVTYRLQRIALPWRLRRWPSDPRNQYEKTMHVNEQTRGSLRRALRHAGFAGVEVRPGQWVYADFVPSESARRLYHRLAKLRLTAPLGVCNLFATGVKA
jgi:ubiquinone/menaquinone biosynthesis C-methylase UbiE